MTADSRHSRSPATLCLPEEESELYLPSARVTMAVPAEGSGKER